MALSRRTLTRVVLLTVIVLCGSHRLWGCPNVGKLTITYSWIPDRVVDVQNSGVPSSAVDTALANWNLVLGGPVDCYGPSFQVNGGSGPMLDLAYTAIPNQGN